MSTPNSLDIRTLRCFDGLHYSFQLLKYYHSKLWETCCNIQSDNTQAIPALAACWGFIDALHRIREIAQSVPGLSSKHSEMRIFLSNTSLAEDARHYIQHLRNELAKQPQNTFPVWGSLSWVDKNNPRRTHTAMLGAQIPGTNYSGCVYDTIENRWVSKVCLGVGEYSFNFDSIFDISLRFEEFILPHIKNNMQGDIQFHNKLPIFTLDLNFIPREQ